MRLVFAGTPAAAVPALRALIASERHHVAGVLTRPDARSGRGRTLRPSPVKEVAHEHAIEVLTPARVSDPEVSEALSRWAPDCCPVVAYGGLITPDLLVVPAHGWINLHFSLLPAWRGAAPVQAAIAAGDEVTGASTFEIERGLDTGPVYGVVTEKIAVEDTATSLLDRLSVIGAELLVRTLDGIEDGELAPVPQSTDGISHAPKISVEAARVNWSLPDHIVDRHIRAMTDEPGAWTMLGDTRIKVGPVNRADHDPLPPGVVAVTKKSVIVGTGGGAVALGAVQPPGKKAMSAADWARGAHLTDGAVLS